MNKLLLIYGCVLFSSSPIVEQQESTVNYSKTSNKIEVTRIFENSLKEEEKPFDIREIEFLEIEEEFELGLDTSKFLPEDFNPYQEEVSIDGINFMTNEVIVLGFDTKKYLPENFDPYARSN